MKTAEQIDLGVQPAPTRGDPKPDFFDRVREARAERVLPFLKTNYIEHEPQSAVCRQLLSYIRSVQPLLGTPIDGRRLSEFSNAGKSRMIEHLVNTAAAERAEQGLPPNPYQIISVELAKSTTVAAFFRQVLKKMDVEHWDDKRSTTDDLENQIKVIGRRLGAQAIVADEAQHLKRKTTDAEQVTDRFKTFLNRGILPLILVGDETADAFFKENDKFACRLGTALQLKPLDFRNDAHDRGLLLEFCNALDQSLADAGILDEKSGLGRAGIRTQLAEVSGGHVGRVCRLVGEAAQHALRRGAPAIEKHDLSVATREFAIGLKWISRDPFSRRGKG